MKYILLIIIRLYWLVPAGKRRRCLFTESCSRYVYRITSTHGYRAGLRALRTRRRQCRPGYYIVAPGTVCLADGSLVPAGHLHEHLTSPFRHQLLTCNKHHPHP